MHGFDNSYGVHTKLENMKELQKQRVLSLVKESDTYEKHALAIECNVENVQNAILVVNSLLANGMEWEQMNDVVQQEKKNGNPIALMISALNLDTNTMYLLLPKDDEVGLSGHFLIGQSSGVYFI